MNHYNPNHYNPDHYNPNLRPYEAPTRMIDGNAVAQAHRHAAATHLYAPPPLPAAMQYGRPRPSAGEAGASNLRYASWGRRVAAVVLDSFLVLPFSILSLYLTLLFREALDAAPEPTPATPPYYLLGIAALASVLGTALSLWNTVFRQGRTGSSFGKRAMGIRIVLRATGAPLGPGTTFVRLLAHVLDTLPLYIGYLWPLLDAHRQTFADKVVGSIAIRA